MRMFSEMSISYKKLWHLLIDRNMKKKDLQHLANLTHYTMNKLSRDEDVTTETLGKICAALNCKVDDVLEILPEISTEEIARSVELY